MLVVYIFVALASYNTQYLTLPMRSSENFVDEAGMIATIDTKTGKIIRSSKRNDIKDERPRGSGKKSPRLKGQWLEHRGPRTKFTVDEEVNWNTLWSIGTDGVMDVPIGGVCEILYGAGSGSDTDVEEHYVP